MWVATPSQLQSQYPAGGRVEIAVNGTSRPGDAFTVVQNVVTLYARSTKAQIPGSWSWTGTTGPTFEFTYQPSSSLPDGDYVVAVAAPADVRAWDSKVLFHVGSMPRVRALRLQTDATKVTVTKVGAEMSEQVNTGQVPVVVEVKTQAGWAPVPTQLKSAPVASTIVLELSSAIALTETLRITVPVNISAVSGKQLDGKYTGQAGSGPLVVELVPASYLKQNEIVWKPSLQL